LYAWLPWIDAGTKPYFCIMMTPITVKILFAYRPHLTSTLIYERELSMRVSKELTAEHKEQIIAAAGRRFRERCFQGISVADLMKEVGLTHGGFYRHFSSKDELIAAASLRAVDETIGRWRKIADSAGGDRFEAIVTSCLSMRHYDHPETACLMATLGSEVSRQAPSVKQAVTAGEHRMIDFLSGIAPGKTKALRRQQAIVAFASMVGGLTLARMTSDVALRQEILKDVAHSVPRSVRASI
jgi:TetR/AcrR family transcriptional repressor of nem operon